MAEFQILGLEEGPDAQGYDMWLHMNQRLIHTPATGFKYNFENSFHPFVDELLEKLNRESLAGALDAGFHDGLEKRDSSTFFDKFYATPQNSAELQKAYKNSERIVEVVTHPKEIDLSIGGPYANYNWELLFHIPLTIAVHLSKNQRFAEAQRWFHYIFDPTCNDTSVPPPQRFWKFLKFRNPDHTIKIDEFIALLSTAGPEDDTIKEILGGYNHLMHHPFQPHAVARTRPVAYQYCVVMKYLDNLIAWGDSLFRQGTLESINEATQRYVLANNILGERPQRIPSRGATHPMTYAKLKPGLNKVGNALVELEGKLPRNLGPARGPGGELINGGPLLGIGHTLYFCVPHNDNLLAYWDTVADRLSKIRNCMTIEGVVRKLALFDPPIDPGMLVKAAAAGLDLGSVISGLNQPASPVRSMLLIQKALELCAEVRGLGAALLAALEKGDGERVALLRQAHEIKIHQMTQDVRFLQWKQAQESSESLLRSRATALERYRYYLRLLGLTPDSNLVPETFPLDRRELTEENFDEAYGALVGQYEKAIPAQALPQLRLAGETSPANQSGAAGHGKLYLNVNENADLNVHSADAKSDRNRAAVLEMTASGLALIPGFNIDMHFWGLGASSQIAAGSMFAGATRAVSSHFASMAQNEERAGQDASKTSSFERRVDEWILQGNLAARELVQIGRQLLGSLIAEQSTHREYLNVQKQIAQSEEVDQFLHDKFTNEELYAWMQGEISRLYYEYYRFAFDTARKAEATMKQELMRPELDSMEFIKYNYWDGGRKGLLSGEALHLDLKRMELAYHEHNKREYELTRHVSLQQLDPLALLTLKVTGSCEVTIPEWLFDLDCPGHYLRRIKNVSLSIPCVAGPYTSINCTLSLLKSTIRKSPILKGDMYDRDTEADDDRFRDFYGTIESIVTSSGQNDSGMFETNLRDERFLPFEGSGAADSRWRLELPAELRQFDYDSISDIILHLRYTARQGGALLVDKAVLSLQKRIKAEENVVLLTRLFSLKHDFPSEWQRYLTSDGTEFKATIKPEHFPYIVRGKPTIVSVKVMKIIDDNGKPKLETLPEAFTGNLVSITQGLANANEAERQVELSLALPSATELRNQKAHVLVLFQFNAR